MDPVKWAALEAATDEYIAQQASRLDAAAAALTMVGALARMRKKELWAHACFVQCR